MKNILINDGLSQAGKNQLKTFGFNEKKKKISQDKLSEFINKNSICVILVRSATEIRKDIIDKCPTIKLIGRGGVGLDNIDVNYAKEKGIHVINTPSASSQSVAELVFAHLFGIARFTYHSNRTMPLEGDLNFKNLKKNYSNGIELRGKTIGIIGFGKIGQEVAKIAIGIGMKVLYYDLYNEEEKITIEFYNTEIYSTHVVKSDFSNTLKNSDFITLHVPKQKKALINKKELEKMKKGAIIINTSRGGIINETDLIESLNNRKTGYAGLDVYEDEPKPRIDILMNDYISLSPHIGASTQEAQDRIGLELANQINQLVNG